LLSLQPTGSYTLSSVPDNLPISIPTEDVAAYCQRHGIVRLALFGSVLRDDFSPESDVDVLVEFAPGRTPDMFTMVHLQSELSSLIGRRVDLRTPRELSKHFRDRVLAEARVLHAA